MGLDFTPEKIKENPASPRAAQAVVSTLGRCSPDPPHPAAHERSTPTTDPTAQLPSTPLKKTPSATNAGTLKRPRSDTATELQQQEPARSFGGSFGAHEDRIALAIALSESVAHPVVQAHQVVGHGALVKEDGLCIFPSEPSRVRQTPRRIREQTFHPI